MTLELIIFIASILFGATIYWRESNGNTLYRFFNKLMNSKELQMKSTNKKGFVYQQSFLLRLIFITALFLVAIMVARFIIPIDVATISIFSSMIVGTLIGTYVANFIFKSTKVIDEQSDSIEDLLHNSIEKGKDFMDDLKSKESKEIDKIKIEEKSEVPKKQEKSARERLKDKGLL